MSGAVQRALQLNLDGLAWAERRDFAKAWQCYSEAIRLHPHNGAFFHNRGLASYEGGHFQHALNDFNASLQLEPSNPETLCARAMSHAKLQQDDLALADYAASLKLGPQYSATWSNRGSFFAAREDWQSALHDWQQARALQPGNASYWYLVGEALCHLYDHAQAFGYLDKAIELGERGHQAFMWRGLCKRFQDDLEGAIADLNVALQLKPDHYHSLMYRGEICHMAGQNFQAFEDYSRLINLGDDGPRVRRQRAELFIDAGKLKEAWSDLEVALKFDPHSLRTYRWRVKALELGGRHELAERERLRMDELARAQAETLRPHGVEVAVALVQANRLLYEPGDSEEYCAVLLSFDPAWSQQPARLQFLASIVYSVKNTTPVDPNMRAIADMVTNEAAEQYRRRRLPTNVTEGATIYFADLLIYRRFLPGTMLKSGQLLRVLAEPGDMGRIELLPQTN